MKESMQVSPEVANTVHEEQLARLRREKGILYRVTVLPDGTILMDDGVNQILQPPARVSRLVTWFKFVIDTLRSPLANLLRRKRATGPYFRECLPYATTYLSRPSTHSQSGSRTVR